MNIGTGISDSLAALQNEVAPLKVFKRKELIELFKKYHKWFDNKRNCSTKQRREGRGAFDLIVLHNLKLVIKIAHQYKYAGMEPEDLVNEGTIGLMTAVERFDVNNGAAFSTYSALWIKQCIRRCLSNKSRTIRIPVHNAEKIGKIKDFIASYKTENNNADPSIEEIKKNIKGISKKALNDLVNGGVLNLLSVDFQLSSDGEESATFGEILEDKKIVVPDSNGEFLDNVRHLTGFINKLKRKERVIIRRRFGLGNKKPETLEEIADSYDLSRERVRQIQCKAMRRLRYLMGYKYGENFFIPVEFRVEKIYEQYKSPQP